MVKVNAVEKIGTTEVIRVRSHAHTIYLPLSKDLVRAFDIKKGDLLKIKIEGRIQEEGGEDA